MFGKKLKLKINCLEESIKKLTKRINEYELINRGLKIELEESEELVTDLNKTIENLRKEIRKFEEDFDEKDILFSDLCNELRKTICKAQDRFGAR